MQQGNNMCKVDGCGRESMYKAQDVCQKHYFRFMRNGSYETTLSRRYRTSNPAGYQRLYEPAHALADSSGYVYEHRLVYYNEISSEVTECALCGASVDFSSCHIDHIDTDVTNNSKTNLRALCRGCNVFRGHTAESMGGDLLECDGKSMTATAWARMDGVEVSSGTIRNRKQRGLTDCEAIFSPRKTHTATATKKYATKHDEKRGIPTQQKQKK